MGCITTKEKVVTSEKSEVYVSNVDTTKDIIDIFGIHIIQNILEFIDFRKRCELMKICTAWCSAIRHINEFSPLKRGCVEAYEIGKIITRMDEGTDLEGRHRNRNEPATFREGKDKATGRSVLLKEVRKEFLESYEIVTFVRLVSFLVQFPHKNIMKMYELVQNDDAIYVVTEVETKYQSLFDELLSRKTYTEFYAKEIIRQTVDALSRVSHFGGQTSYIEPENILINNVGEVVLSLPNFGNLQWHSLRCAVGIPDYIAPEVLTGESNTDKTFVWFVGVLAYTILCGYRPFGGENVAQQFNAILGGIYDFPSPDWNSISTEAKDFISKSLIVDLDTRQSILQCLDHPWLKAAESALTAVIDISKT